MTGSSEGAQAPPDFWVFAYGSLMWRPGFDFAERTLATIRGYRRALCVYSHWHRGTPEQPGLVLGLDRGGSCRGVAYRVAPERASAVLAYLREREQVTMVYREVATRAVLADGRAVQAISYVVDRAHVQYAGALPPATVERLVRGGIGHSGANPDYVRQTFDHMREIGVRDSALAALVARLTEVAPDPSD